MGDFACVEDRCDACLENPPPWDWGRAALRYQGHARKLILGFKHGDRQDVAVAAGYWMSQRIRALVDPDAVLCPIPLHWRRKLSRRYNQAELLAREMARNLGVPVRSDLLMRPRATIPLEEASATERHRRLADAFAISSKAVKSGMPQSVILIDDVMTSGATLTAAAMCLKQAGVPKINICVLARVGQND